jgi:hypothetical protein
MPDKFQFSVDLTHSSTTQLRLITELQPHPEELLELLKSWLQNSTAFSQIQAEQGADWIKIRFYFKTQPFYLHFEHYSECYWIDADSQVSLVLLSQLAEFITSIEHNHGLRQP